jgi:hypothetical protein
MESYQAHLGLQGRQRWRRGGAALRWSSMVTLQCSLVTARWSTRSSVMRRCRMCGRSICVLPGIAPGNGRRSFGGGELRLSRVALISYVKSIRKNVMRCTRVRGEGECQNRVAVSLGVAGFDETWRRMSRAPVSYCVSLAAPQTGKGERNQRGGVGN